MGAFLKIILLAVVLILAAPFLLAIFGIGVGILVPLVMVPIGLVVGLIGGFIGLVFGLFGGLIGLVAAAFGMLFSVLKWVVYLVFLALLVGFGVWLLNRMCEKSGRCASTKFDEDESEAMDEIRRGMGRMGKRLDSLETILEEDEKGYT